MKNIFFAIATLSLFAACSNAPVANESISNVNKLKNWVDSIKSIVDTTKSFDSTTWANYSAEFQNGLSAINVTEIDETSNSTLESIKEAWTSVGDQYAGGITKSKETVLAPIENPNPSPSEVDIKKVEGTMIEKVVDKAIEIEKAEAKKVK